MKFRQITNYHEPGDGNLVEKKHKIVSVMRETHWLMQKFQQLTKLIVKPFNRTEQQ